MKVEALDFLHLQVPFKTEFAHARKSRSHGDTIMVRVVTAAGATGWGEILPRPYVTGESIDSIMRVPEPAIAERNQVKELADSLLLKSFADQAGLTSWIDRQLPSFYQAPALFGGVELALWNAYAQESELDLEQLLGVRRTRKTGKCITIGFDAAIGDMRARAINARLQRATVVKLKIGAEGDSERLKELARHLPAGIAIRADANGCFNETQLAALLASAARETNSAGDSASILQSVEEPIGVAESAAHQSLVHLYEEFKVPFVADESLCTIEDAQQCIEAGCWQIFNLRVGKHGGLHATRRIRDLALDAGLGLVSGSMVGESGVLTQASRLLLDRTDALDYVEGLGQNESFLASDPVRPSENSSMIAVGTEHDSSEGTDVGSDNTITMQGFVLTNQSQGIETVSIRSFGSSAKSGEQLAKHDYNNAGTIESNGT